MSLMNIFNVSGSAASAQSQRLNVVASNLANADTVAGPDGQAYKARQVMFQTQLMGAGNSATAAGVRAEANLRYATPSQTNLDRNTVDMDRECASFADHSLKYEAALRFINGSMRTMLDAIKGQS